MSKGTPPLINLSNFWKNTALGRTLSGRNKTGQAIESVVKPVLIATGLKGTTDAIGTITGAEEQADIARKKKKPVSKVNLNLTPTQERVIRLVVFGVVIVLFVFDVDLAQLDWDGIKTTVNSILEALGL